MAQFQVMSGDSYILSFTAGGLLYHESIAVAEAFASCGDWEQTLQAVNDKNLLQSRVQATTVRKLREIRFRLQGLTPDQLQLLVDGSRTDQNMLLWLACCKRYRLLAEFASEILRDKFVRLELVITPEDIDAFMEAKALWHEELEQLKDSTRVKLRTVIMRMLRESELVSTKGVIQPKLLSSELVQVIADDSIELFSCFPVSETDVKGAMQ